MVRKNFKIGGLDASNVNIRANGFAATLTANSSLASNVSFRLPGSTGTSGQVLSTDGSGNLYFSDSSANTKAYVSGTLISNTALILEAGSGVALSANANSGVISFSTSMSNVTSQTIAVNGSANVFTLAKSVNNSHMVLVSYNGLLQGPEEYSVSGTTLTISNSKPLLSDSKIEVRYFDFFELPGASAGGGGGESYTFQGEVSGYTAGGLNSSNQGSNVIDKFPFATNANATDVGDLSQTRERSAGQSSSTSGYTTGGYTTSAPYVALNTIDKFSFSADGNATDVGDLTVARQQVAGQSSSTSGYTSGGITPGAIFKNEIDKSPFSSDANATDVGNLIAGTYASSGQSSSTHGYIAGGGTGSMTNKIEKFSFSTDGNASDVGDLTGLGRYGAGQSSSSSGYNSGNSSPYSNVIEKFPFATDANATDVGDLTVVFGRGNMPGQSSTTSGYSSGGASNSEPNGSNVIDKFPFATDSNATDVGDLTQARRRTNAGQQV